MFVILAMFFVFGISVSSAIGAPSLKWDVLQDGEFIEILTVQPGCTFPVDLWVTDVPSPGASSFEIDMKYDTNILKVNSVTVNDTDWTLSPYTDWTSIPGRISAGGSAPQGKGHTGNVRLITIEFECIGGGTETFDFTEDETFYLGKLGGGEFDVDKETYALTIIWYESHFNIDIDMSGDVRPLSDGLLITRYLFGFRGNNLVSGAVDPNGNQTTASDIADWIERGRVEPSPSKNDNYVYLDVDKNGEVTALTDGIMILRHLFGYTGANLTAGAIGPNAKRTDPSAIAGYIDSLK